MFDYLFAQPSFLSGVARCLDLGGTFDEYNESPTPAQADATAILNDWLAVGADLRHGLDAAKEEVVQEAAQ